MLPDDLILRAVAGSSMRSATAVHRRMKRGVNSLATIASIAPLLGFLGTFMGVANSFLGVGGEQWAYEAATVERISRALMPAALGLFVAILAFSFYRYCCSSLNVIDVQMRSATIELVNYLGRRRG